MTMQRRHCIATALICWALGNSALAQSPPANSLLIVGDSLSAEYGLPRGSGWAALLQARLNRDKPGWQVHNASISGDTTSGGRSRLAALLKKHQPRVVVLELGGNDALRGLPLNMTRDNLRAMVRASTEQGAKVLLIGMQVPPNYGPEYTQAFSAVFETVAKSEKVALVPFFLQGIADGADPLQWFQADRIHPNAAAQAKMLDNVWPSLKRLLE